MEGRLQAAEEKISKQEKKMDSAIAALETAAKQIGILVERDEQRTKEQARIDSTPAMIDAQAKVDSILADARRRAEIEIARGKADGIGKITQGEVEVISEEARSKAEAIRMAHDDDVVSWIQPFIDTAWEMNVTREDLRVKVYRNESLFFGMYAESMLDAAAPGATTIQRIKCASDSDGCLQRAINYLRKEESHVRRKYRRSLHQLFQLVLDHRPELWP